MAKETYLVRVRPGDRFTPVALAKKLGATALLESSSLSMSSGRYSILLVREAFRVVAEMRRVSIQFPDDRKKLLSDDGDVLDLVANIARQHRDVTGSFPLPLGGVGYLSYEYCQLCDDIPLREKEDSLEIPTAVFLFGHSFVVFDHYSEQLFYVGVNYREAETDLETLLSAMERRVDDMDFTYLQTHEEAHAATVLSDTERVDAEYKEGVERIHDFIRRGDSYQCVLSRRLRVKTTMPAFECYRRLRRTNPAPYLFYLDFGDFQLFGASPEAHAKVHEKRATMHPIAGTRRRGATVEEDEALAAELRGDEKECAEHLMLVDLARNDLGRVAVPGSIAVEHFMHVEYFAKVMHMVSSVHATLRPGIDAADVIRATFPAGTLTGAPKIRSIEISDGIETEKRSFYAGIVGYFDAQGGCDTCITIRSAVKKGDVVHMQVGAGIVYDSNALRELEETREKLSALVESLGMQAE